MTFSIIAAVDSNMGIGKNGRLPWHLPADLAYFNKTTVGNGKNAVIMGRLTWESLPLIHRPLEKRINIIITRNHTYALPEGVFRTESLEEALRIASRCVPKEIFVIGGSQIFYNAIQHPNCAKIYLTEIDGDFNCDAFFPKIDPRKFKKNYISVLHEENGIFYKFAVYEVSYKVKRTIAKAS